MSGNTANEGFPYPLESDFADVQDAYRLATAVDADILAQRLPLRAFMSRPSFVARQTATSSGFLSGSTTLTVGAVDWDNTGGIAVGSTAFQQPVGQAPSWCMFGGTLLSAAVSGTPVVGDLTMGRIRVATTDQVSGVVTASNLYQRNDETNTGGEWINLFTMAAVYRASVSLALLLNGSTQRGLAAGSTFWGFCMGPVT